MPALGAAVAILSPMMGTVADRYPARWLFALGLVGASIFSVAMSAVTATWQIWVLYAPLFPASITLCSSIASNAIVSRWFVRRAGLALGLSATGLGIAGALLPPLIAFAMPFVGWREVWRAAGILTVLVVLPLVVWIVRERSTERDGFQYMDGVAAASPSHGLPLASNEGHKRSGAPDEHETRDLGVRGDNNLRWRDILTRRNFWLLAFCFIPIVGLYFGTQQNLALIVASRGMTAKTASFLLAVFALLHVIATPILGLAADRFGSRLPLAFVGILAMIGGVLFGYGDSLPVLLAGWVAQRQLIRGLTMGAVK